MATIDDLVKATRSKRVQVADLPDAPKLKPTVRSGGQYTVAVQQAGKNKLMDLADALSKVNPMLKDYKGIADLELEAHEKQLASLDPEDLKKQLKQTEGEFDKMSRKGGFVEWMLSPVNEVRKRRALGKAAHDQFVQGLISSEGRLNKPQEGDNDLTTAKIIEQEYDKFVADNPALQGQYAGEGFREAVNPTILNLTNRYDQQKAQQSKRDTLLGNTSSIYRLAKNATVGSAQYDLDMSKALEDWDDLNAFPPAQQLKVIEDVAKNLAGEKGGQRKAESFLLWAQSNLKVGNASFAVMEDQVDRMESLVDSTAESADRLRDEDRKDKIQLKSAEFGLLSNQLARNGSVVINEGEDPIKTKEALIERFQLEAEEDEDSIYAFEVSREFEKITLSDLDPNQYTKNNITKSSYVYGNIGSLVRQKMVGLKPTYANLISQNPGAWTNIQIELFNKIQSEADAEMERMINAGEADDPKQAARALDGYLNDKMLEFDKEAVNRLETLDKEIIQGQKDESEYTEQVKPPEDPTEPSTENIFFDESNADIMEKTHKNLFVLTNPDSSPRNKKLALQYNNKYLPKALKETAKIAIGGYKKKAYRPYNLALKGGLKVIKPEIRYGRNDNIVQVELAEHTFEERKKARDEYFRMARVHGVFADLEVLKSGVTRDGMDGFDVETDINSASFVLIKADRLKAIKDVKSLEDVPDDVKEIADLIGESDDYLKFIRNQVRLQKALFDPNFEK